MNILLFLASVLCFVIAGNMWLGVQSAIHQILVAIWLLISAVLFCAGAVVDRLKANQANGGD